MQNLRKIGSTYEKTAAQYLEKTGYRILERNFRCKSGELDLIALDGNVLVFLEVKYRKNAVYGTPAEAVTRAKQRTICKVAAFYRLKYGVSQDVPCRFDVVAILGEQIEVIKNAFDFS